MSNQYYICRSTTLLCFDILLAHKDWIDTRQCLKSIDECLILCTMPCFRRDYIIYTLMDTIITAMGNADFSLWSFQIPIQILVPNGWTWHYMWHTIRVDPMPYQKYDGCSVEVWAKVQNCSYIKGTKLFVHQGHRTVRTSWTQNCSYIGSWQWAFFYLDRI